jgi:hypothetical protein
VNAGRQANIGLALSVVSLILIPFAYAWIPAAGHNPDWMGFVVPIGEWGGLACAVAAIWLGGNARRAGQTLPAATWASRIGAATIVLWFVAFLVVATTYH